MDRRLQVLVFADGQVTTRTGVTRGPQGGSPTTHLASGKRYIVAGILTAVFFLAAAAAQTTRSVWDGVYAEEQSKRGQALYTKECASCHGAELTGGERFPPLAGAEFLASWNGLTVGELFERMRQSMPQDDPGKLSPQENADVLSYILAVNKFPAGKSELDRNTGPLKQIKIEATKPEK